MWELDHRKGWMMMNWCFQIVVLEKTLERCLDSKIKPVNPKGNQPWIFIGRTDAGAEAPILWPPDVKSWLIGKDPDAGKDWGQEEKGAREDEMVGWHHQLNGQAFEQTLGDSKREAWHTAVHVVTKSQTWLSDWTSHSTCMGLKVHICKQTVSLCSYYFIVIMRNSSGCKDALKT